MRDFVPTITILLIDSGRSIYCPLEFVREEIVDFLDLFPCGSLDGFGLFLASGEFLWNSGIFVWRADAIRQELEKHAPEITHLWKGWQEVLGTDNQKSFLERIYTDMPRTSIDYAVMEKSDDVHMIPGHWMWSDLGSFEAIEKITGKKLK